MADYTVAQVDRALRSLGKYRVLAAQDIADESNRDVWEG